LRVRAYSKTPAIDQSSQNNAFQQSRMPFRRTLAQRTKIAQFNLLLEDGFIHLGGHLQSADLSED
jgi:hypothetical protein